MALNPKVREYFLNELDQLRKADLFKEERFIHSPQAASIGVEFPTKAPVKPVLNFCANNYLGLSSHPALIEAARKGLEERGYGMSSVRFICGTQDIHRKLEQKMSRFLGMDDTILYSSCFDANGGIFETILGEEDAIISDELNHASIIDGIRLCKAERRRYKHLDLQDLEEQLRQSQNRRFRMIATDGVFSMDGHLAPLDKIADLADRYDAILMVDDSHATGFMGKTGRGTHEHFGVQSRVDIITTTFGKALGGASGGCISGRQFFIDMLRQRSRPYLFSNSVSPIVVMATLKALELLESSTELRDRLEANTRYFRKGITDLGFTIQEGFTSIVPVMLQEARVVQEMARALYNEGIYAVGFFYPVVPKGKARIRVQISAAHTSEHLDQALAAFGKVGKAMGIIGK